MSINLRRDGARYRRISVVVTGSSIGSAAIPKKPPMPPLTPASTEAVWRAGGRFDRGSIERMAMFSALRMAASTTLLKWSLAAFGIKRIARAIGRPA